MPSTTAPSIFGAAVQAWVDAFRAVVAMPAVATIGFALLLAIGLAADLLPPLIRSGAPETLGQSLIWSGAASMVESFLLAPLGIAIHRYLLLGEVTRGYALQLADHRFLRFFYFSFALALLQTILFFVATLAFPVAFDSPASASEMNEIGLAAAGAIILGILAVTARLILVYPAAAIDAPGANWGDAWRATSGHFWTVALIFTLIGLPLLLLWRLVSGLLEIGETSKFVQTFSMLQEMLSLCAYTAAAARLYQVFGAPLGGAAGSRDGSVV